MTDYNDGKWHGWNGGECPVHPKSEVQVLHSDNGILNERRAGIEEWSSEYIIAFRVTKPHKEPREFWIDPYGYAHDNPKDAKPTSPMQSAIHVREVIE